MTTQTTTIETGRLGTRTRIPPHFGNANHRLTVHLPLIVPSGCGVEVGGEARETRFGRLMMDAFLTRDTKAETD